jgi:hypothetical protein
MDSTGLNDDNQTKNLGNTLIRWIKTLNENKAKHFNGSENNTENNKHTDSQNSDRISLNIDSRD